jgi:hypothetical protein
VKSRAEDVMHLLGPALFTVGVVLALLINIQVGSVTMGLGIALHLLGDGIALGIKGIWRRPVAVVIPLVIAVALVTVALLLPRSSL